MKITRWFRERIMSVKAEDESDGIMIKDGMIIGANEKSYEQETDTVVDYDEKWDVEREYVDYLIRRDKKDGTIKGYCCNLRSFKMNVNEITVNDIEKRMEGLAKASRTRIFTALRSYAKWQSASGEFGLQGTLSSLEIMG